MVTGVVNQAAVVNDQTAKPPSSSKAVMLVLVVLVGTPFLLSTGIFGDGDVVEAIILLCVIVIAVGMIVVIPGLPGHIATKRNHKQATAIKILGYLGLLILPCWIVAIVWAFLK